MQEEKGKMKAKTGGTSRELIKMTKTKLVVIEQTQI